MQTSKQYQLTLEDGERRVITEAELKAASTLFYTEIGPGFGMEAVIAITPLPQERITQNDNTDSNNRD